jgi:hypothetical protein
MPIKIKSEPGIYRPIVICDACEKEIEEAKKGTVVFIPSTTDPAAIMEMFTVHNNHECFARFEKARNDFASDIPLPAFLIYLERGLKLNRKDAETEAKLLSWE